MTVLLKQLDIHGFKSFATPTTFVFDRGITAIIGPNGSGKSNVAEALRWALGEQGYANLRSRRTEDVIFAGSDKRAQLGLAEVTLTLDNGDGDLPLPFSEITITRRAYRTGESQCLINGSRVRLKDVQQLVAPLGQSYTIIGQGLVDAALSQRPEERRGLFEHAAGISGLRLRADEAERSLAETSANSQRLRDILGELEPRVRSLERSARLAREYGDVRDRLYALQRRYYAYLWRLHTEKLSTARRRQCDVDAAHEEHEAEHQARARALSALRGDERRLTEAERQFADRVAADERELAEQRHRRALLDERAHAAAERLRDLQSRLEELERERQDAADEDTHLTAEAREIEQSIVGLESQLAEWDAQLAVLRQRRMNLQQQVDHLDRQLIEKTRDLVLAESRRTALAERRGALESEVHEAAAAIDRDRERQTALRAAIDRVERRLAELQIEIERVGADAAARDRLLVTLSARISAQRSQVDATERERAALQNRLELLARSHASGEGLFAGVRAVLRATRKGDLQLPGLIGTLAETIEVPQQYETAIDVALGGHLQDIVVERWSDVQVAIEYLKRANAGRATFQPLDTVRARRRPPLDIRDPDCLGVAADLVGYDDRVAPIVEQTLGRTLVVTDLDSARRILVGTSGWTLVTLSGEIARPSGSVTGGAKASETGLVGRERERRTLPAKIAALDVELQATRDALERDTRELGELDANRRMLQSALDELHAQLRETIAERDRLRQAVHIGDAELNEQRQRLAALEERRVGIGSDESAAEANVNELLGGRDRLHTERERLAEMLTSTPPGEDERLIELRAAFAAARERLRSTQAAARRAHERVESAAKGIAARKQEADRITAETAARHDERAAIDGEIERLVALLASSREASERLQHERVNLEAALSQAERDLDRATAKLREAERERDRATLTVARVQDEQVFLAERIRNDLDLDDPGELEDDAVEVGEAPDEREIARLRERLRRMSVVGEDVLEQYETESRRLNDLTDQLTDIEQAADGLRKVLAELNQRMAERFAATFQEVAAEFQQTFTRLFGGGSARLLMDDGENGSSGIDIVARPPGKRLQSLNALSGGERALTAVALLIAIQRVNPSPFCLLDEVDAALDESNVIRFRDELRDLAGSTQFVVITHNRGTIEGANTLYGVTMGGDGISRVLSLRLDEAIHAVEEYEVVQVADD